MWSLAVVFCVVGSAQQKHMRPKDNSHQTRSDRIDPNINIINNNVVTGTVH